MAEKTDDVLLQKFWCTVLWSQSIRLAVELGFG